MVGSRSAERVGDEDERGKEERKEGEKGELGGLNEPFSDGDSSSCSGDPT